MKKLFIAAAFVLAACSSNVEVTDVLTSIEDARITPPLEGRDVAAGYFTILVDGKNDRLVGARSTIADTIELHTHIMDDGVMRMREIDGVDLPDGEEVTFERGGLHLMMFGANIPEGATEAEVTLIFEGGDEKTITMRIGD